MAKNNFSRVDSGSWGIFLGVWGASLYWKVDLDFWFGHPKCLFWYPQNGQKDAVLENAIELKNQNEGSIINIKIHTKNQPKFFGKFSSWQHALVSISKIVNYLWHLRMWSFQSNIRVNRHVNIWHQSPLWTFQNSPCNVFLPSENILIYWYWKYMSYLISLHHLLSENTAHVGSFSFFVFVFVSQYPAKVSFLENSQCAIVISDMIWT